MTRRWKIQQVVGKNSQSAQNFCGWWLVWKTEIFGIRSCSWTRSSQPSPPAWQLLRSHQSNIGPAASLPKSQHKDLNFYDKFKTHHLDLLNLSFDANWCRCRRAVAAQAVFFMCLFSEKISIRSKIRVFLKCLCADLCEVPSYKRKILNNMIAFPATPRTGHSQVPLAPSILYDLHRSLTVCVPARRCFDAMCLVSSEVWKWPDKVFCIVLLPNQ